MKKVIVLLLGLLLIGSVAQAANIQPTATNGGFMWELGGRTTTGDTDILVGTLACQTYSMYITATGTVSITAAVKMGASEITAGTIQTYTLSSATTTGYTWSNSHPFMYVTYTITTGAIGRTYVECNTGGK